MMPNSRQYKFVPKKKDGMFGTVILYDNNIPIYSDEFNIGKASKREAFAKTVHKKFPGNGSIEIVKDFLLGEVHRCTSPPAQEAELEIMDRAYVVRPHLFHIPDMSGLLVPVIHNNKGAPQGRWLLLTQQPEGERYCREVCQNLELPNGKVLSFNPVPVGLSAEYANESWSKESRDKWLTGYTPNPTEIFKKLKDLFAYYLEFPDEDKDGHLSVLSLWTMLTYVYEAWESIPYISVGGTWGSGKSTIFEVLSKVVFNPLDSSGTTPACLFRSLHSKGGILLLDEAERLRERTGEQKDLLIILRAGQKKSQAYVDRLEEVGGTWVTKRFCVYGPKAIAAIKSMESALASRCIRIIMFKATKDSPVICHRLIDKTDEFKAITDELHAFALCYGKTCLSLAKDFSLCSGMAGRETEVWQPMLGLASLIEEDGFVERIREHADKSIVDANEDAVPETDELILTLLWKESQEGSITAGELLRKAGEQREMFIKSAKGISSLLNKYGIKSDRRKFRLSEEHKDKIQDSYGIDFGESNDPDGGEEF